MADRKDTEKLFGKTLNPDGTLRAVSPSQTISFKRCPLRWHFDKKGKLQKKPMGKGAAKGDASHDRMKVFLTTGQDVRGSLELVGAKMLEPYLWAAPFDQPGHPAGPGLIEEALLNPRVSTPGGILITGYFDYYIPGAAERWPIIIDHKFKKDLDKWGIDEDELRDDPQTLCYGTWALMRQPEAPGVVMRHHQHQTEGAGGMYPLPVEVKLTRDDLLRRWGVLAQLIDGPMVEAAKVPPAMPGETPDGVPYNTEACGDFGGCDFARTCKHSPMNSFRALLRSSDQPVTSKPVSTHYTEVNPMGLLTQINAAPSTTPAAGSTPQTPTAMVAALQESIAVLMVIPVTKAQPGALYMIPGGSVAKFEGQLGSKMIFRDKAGGLRDVPPDASVRTTDEETLCLFEGRPYVKKAMVGAAAEVEAATGQAPPVDQTAKVEKARKLGIQYEDGTTSPGMSNPIVPTTPKPTTPIVVATVPASEAVVKVTTAEAIATPPPVATTPPAEPKKRGPKPKTEAPTGTDPVEEGGKLFLLINCSCNRAVDLAGYVKKLCDEVAQRGGAPDVRLGHKNSDLGFGGWKALIAMEAAKAPPSGLCSITSGELADPIIEALIPLAAVVVRGGVR